MNKQWYISFEECIISDQQVNDTYYSLGKWSDESAMIVSKRIHFDFHSHESVLSTLS
jgi:hypothetical protein